MAVVAAERKNKVSRRTFLKVAGVAAIGFPLYGTEVSRHEISVERRTIHLRRLPDVFHGMRIVQISDFHYEEFTEPYFLREIVERVNRLKPDAVIFGGDYVTMGILPKSRTISNAEPCIEILSGVACPLRFAVLGNHDSGFAGPAVRSALANHRLPLLYNSNTPLERDGKRLWIAGTGDACAKSVDLNEAVPTASRTDGEAVILLLHEPDLLPQVARYNVDLMLSGHTHGGQIRFPLIPPVHLPVLGKKYVEGLFQLGPTQLYVNRGVGTVGLPMRFNCPPEITEITLSAVPVSRS
ncbi:MAG TPA: metallophosphoesterase [Acidobacteriaceae bacterium]|nr:metallophosphoesterase [Acidobacteriaceae bacterium]